jgi:hypothetical protein
MAVVSSTSECFGYGKSIFKKNDETSSRDRGKLGTDLFQKVGRSAMEFMGNRPARSKSVNFMRDPELRETSIDMDSLCNGIENL